MSIPARYHQHPTSRRILRDRQNHQSSLYFIIRERYRETEARQVMITQKFIEEMMSSGRFGMGQVKFTISSQFSSTEILLSFGDDEYYLSGFPRMLPQEDPPRIKYTFRPHFLSSLKGNPPTQ